MAEKIILCEPCLYVDLEVEAVGFCVTCAECLCSKCVIEHRKAKATRSHELQKDSIPDNADVIKEMNEMLACPIHKEMKISYRCNDHSACICTVCRVDTHRNCERVLEIAKCESLDGKFESVQENLKDLRLSAKSLKDRKEKNKSDLYQSRREILSEQELIIQKAINALEELKTKYVKETDEQLQVALSVINKDIEDIETIEGNAEKNEQICEAVMKYGDSTSPQVIGYKLADTTLKQQHLIKDFSKKEENYKLVFTKNEDCIQVTSLGTLSLIVDEISEIKRKCEKLSIEKTSDEISDDDDSSMQAGVTTLSTTPRCLPTTSERCVSEKRVVSVSVDSDKNYSSICGILVLTDGRLLMIDYNNSNIKLFSSDYNFLHVLRLPGKPIRLCSLRENEVAVSFERVKRINRYSVVGNNIVYEGGFTTTLFNHGLAFDGLCIVAIMCDEDFRCSNNAKDDTIQVEFRDPFNGEINAIIEDFKVEGNTIWSLVLNNTEAIQFTEDSDMIIAEKNRILSFVGREEPERIVAVEKMFYVCQGEVPKDSIENIAIDSQSVFACTLSGCVLQLSLADFRNNRIIVPNTGESLKAIAVDSANGRLILGCNIKDEILVYKINRIA